MGKADRPLWKSLTLTQKIRGEIKSCISQLKVPSATEGGALVRNLKAALRGKNKGDELRFQSPIKAAQCKHFLEIPEGEQFSMANYVSDAFRRSKVDATGHVSPRGGRRLT